MRNMTSWKHMLSYTQILFMNYDGFFWVRRTNEEIKIHEASFVENSNINIWNSWCVCFFGGNSFFLTNLVLAVLLHELHIYTQIHLLVFISTWKIISNCTQQQSIRIHLDLYSYIEKIWISWTSTQTKIFAFFIFVLVRSSFLFLFFIVLLCDVSINTSCECCTVYTYKYVWHAFRQYIMQFKCDFCIYLVLALLAVVIVVMSRADCVCVPCAVCVHVRRHAFTSNYSF